MNRIQNWRGLEEFGINALTGEACAYGLRLLCDLNEDGCKAVSAFLGLAYNPEDVSANFHENWNSTVNGKPAVASCMLPRNCLTDMSIFLLFSSGCDLVIVDPAGGCLGLRESDEYYGRYLEMRNNLSGIDTTYLFKPQHPAVGGRNIHTMTGRTS